LEFHYMGASYCTSIMKFQWVEYLKKFKSNLKFFLISILIIKSKNGISTQVINIHLKNSSSFKIKIKVCITSDLNSMEGSIEYSNLTSIRLLRENFDPKIHSIMICIMWVQTNYPRAVSFPHSVAELKWEMLMNIL